MTRPQPRVLRERTSDQQHAAGDKPLTLRRHEGLTGHCLFADPHRQRRRLQLQIGDEFIAAQVGKFDFSQEMLAVADLRRRRLLRRSDAEGQAIAVVAVLAAELVERHRLAVGQAQGEIALAAADAGL